MLLLSALAVSLSMWCIHGTPIIQPIVNGQDAAQNEYPWQILLKYDGEFYCGGSILNNRTVLTAAHCVEDDPRQRRGKFSIVAGEWVQSINHGTEVEIEVQRVKMHGGYDNFELFNDIAILILKEDLVYTASIQPVGGRSNGDFDKLAESSNNCVVTGWGRFTDRSSSVSDTLQELEQTNVVTNRKCNRALATDTPFSVTKGMICTIDSDSGVCNGDSGGPMGCYDNSGNFIQVGVVSWGPSRQCSDGRQVFTRVSKYTRWINKRLA